MRIGIGHVHERSHATCHGGTALRVDVGLMCQTWLTEMHMLIDDAGNEVFACGIDDSMNRPFDGLRGLVFTDNLGNLSIRNENTCHKGLAFIDKCRIFY